MLTQIEFYDKDIIKNTIGVLSMKPDKVVYVYDKELKDMNRFLSLEKCFKKYLPNIILEKIPVNILSIKEINETTKKVVKENKDCVINLTGGSELMIIGGFNVGKETNSKLIYIDIIKEEVIDVIKDEVIAKTEILNLDDFIDAYGACLIGNSHAVPGEKEFNQVLAMSEYLFRHIKKWKSTCTFLQIAMANTAQTDLDLRMRTEIYQNDGKKYSADKEMLYEFQRHGFIKDLYFSGKYVVFSFASKKYKSYLINYGVWLELYVYISAKKAGVFQDVKLGAMIDWDAYDGINIAGNEIDVIIQDGSLPVFISCKLRSADTATLNEIILEKKRLGGWFSKCMVVSFGEEKLIKNGTYKRAKELGIQILDKSDILSDNFQERLVKSIKGQDLVGLKWKKI